MAIFAVGGFTLGGLASFLQFNKSFNQFDGACGEEKKGKKQVYDWQRYYDVTRRLQPKACINVCGPDIRWCGNEAGDTRAAEWSVVPK